MSFPISKEELVGLVSTCQERSYAEEIEMLEQKGNSIEWLLEGVASSTKHGISNEEVELARRRDAFGTNQKEEHELPGLIELFCEALEDFTLRILLVAAVLSIVLEVSTAPPAEQKKAWVEGFAILVAVFACASVTAINDYQK
jgi:Ca2+ transporting ATPase